MMKQPNSLVVVKGAGDLATGVIHRLSRAGFAVMATELAEPTVVRRTVAFAEAVALGEITVEDVTARLARSIADIQAIIASGQVPIVVDPTGILLKQMRPAVLVEATLSKYNSGITINDAPIVIALGPGYEAGKDAHAVIETNRGHNLGRVYLHGYAEPNTGVPGAIGGYTIERLLRSPCAGILYGVRQIGDFVEAGETVAVVKANGTGDNDAGPGKDVFPGMAGASGSGNVVGPSNVVFPGMAGASGSGNDVFPAMAGASGSGMAGASPATTDYDDDKGIVSVVAVISGILRGLVRDGLHVSDGMKVGDVDPRAAREHCFTISDKSRAIAGGVLEAVLYLSMNRKQAVHAQNRGLS